MSATTTFTQAWPVGRFTCTLTLPANAGGQTPISVHWQPHRPPKLTAAELAEYRRGRDAALSAWAAATGRPVAVVDL